MGLTMNDIKQRMDKRRAWKDFSSPPANKQGTEDVIIKNLTPLFDEMVKTVESLMNNERSATQPWSFITAPRSTPTTTERPSTFKPDAFFHRKGVSNPKLYSYYDIAFTAEFKKVARFANFANVSRFMHLRSFLL